ncbi:sigma-70 family RNA polymerase sigma factor [Limnobacter sp.]|uniref:sigma-70 family RNA polymerase sigma factor n=1 Tax=Limnobacter sp. TaxID=2003368 RepID=UPI0035187BED
MFDALEKAALLERHVPLVQQIARQIQHKLTANVELDDLIQVGMIGLMDALQRYTHGEASFEAYAHYRIRGAIMDDLREKDDLPRAMRQMKKRVEQCVNKLTHALGRNPSDGECAAALGVDLTTFQGFCAEYENLQVFSIEDLGESDSPSNDILDRMLHNPHGLDEQEHKAQQQEEMLKLLEQLSDREQMVLRLYFEQEMTFKEIGSLMGVNESRAYQMHANAIASLKDRAAQLPSR